LLAQRKRNKRNAFYLFFRAAFALPGSAGRCQSYFDQKILPLFVTSGFGHFCQDKSGPRPVRESATNPHRGMEGHFFGEKTKDPRITTGWEITGRAKNVGVHYGCWRGPLGQCEAGKSAKHPGQNEWAINRRVL
jgi:hypothetical protein